MDRKTENWKDPGQTLQPGMMVMVVALDSRGGFHNGRIVSQVAGSKSSVTTFTIEVDNENLASHYAGRIPKELL